MTTTTAITTIHGSTWSTLHLRWLQLGIYLLLHAGAVTALFYFSWSGLALCIFLFSACGGLGVTLCFHRLITHGSFKTFRFAKWLLAVIGCLNFLDGPITWCGTHRIHHANAERELDPHSTSVSFVWAHLEWFFFEPPLRPSDFCLDLLRDPVIVWIEKLSLLPPILLALCLYLAGRRIGGNALGLSWLLWGTCARTVATFHVAGLVNSATHMWGYRNFNTADNSRNLPWVALLTFGEGWHNNHHAQQRSASHGMLAGEFDATWQVIRLLRFIGLAWDVVEPAPTAGSGVTREEPRGSPHLLNTEN